MTKQRKRRQKVRIRTERTQSQRIAFQVTRESPNSSRQVVWGVAAIVATVRSEISETYQRVAIIDDSFILMRFIPIRRMGFF